MSHYPLLFPLLIVVSLITESTQAYELPTIEPMANINYSTKSQPDLFKPIAHSTPIAGFYQQAILHPVDDWGTNQGYFSSYAILIEVRNGIWFISANHYVNNEAIFGPGSIPNTNRKTTPQLTTEQLSRVILDRPCACIST